MERHELIGLDVLVVKHQQVDAHFQNGLANFSNKIPITSSTKYRIASVSKSVIAAATIHALRSKNISLDQDINEILGYSVRNPQYPMVPITTAMLLSHTSSIVDGEGYGQYIQKLYKKPQVLSDLINPEGKYFTDDLYLDKKPGSFFHYSNLGFVIIGAILEKVSGIRLDDYCRQFIFMPLSMDASFNDFSKLKAPENVATLYRGKKGVWKAQVDSIDTYLRKIDFNHYLPGENPLLLGPQGSMRCSAQDLSKFMLLLMNNGVINKDTILHPGVIAEMEGKTWQFDGQNGNSYEGLMQSWGKGLHISSGKKENDKIFKGVTMIGHPGEAYGLLSGMYYNKSKGIGFIYITNGSKKSFVYGKTSSFYRLEEELFNTIFNYLNIPRE